MTSRSWRARVSSWLQPRAADPDEPVRVAVVRQLDSAMLVDLLQAEGIRAFATESGLAGAYGSGGVASTSIFVRAADEARAAALIEEARSDAGGD